jgi:hypothetical protein
MIMPDAFCVTLVQTFKAEPCATGPAIETGALLTSFIDLSLTSLRWDDSQPELFEGQYGVYLMKKVGGTLLLAALS